MRNLKCTSRISILELSLVLTALAFVLPHPKLLDARPTEPDALQGRGDVRHYALDREPAGHRIGSDIQFPVLDERPPHIEHETNKVILLTNGQEIKLYPLKESDLTPSGGYYVIKSRHNFTRNGWKRPLVSDVGYVFDRRFCHFLNNSQVSENDCLVIFWLDKQNKFLHYGSSLFNQTTRIELLSSKFDALSNIKSLTNNNKKIMWLQEFPPINMCKRVREPQRHLEHCDISSLMIAKSCQGLNVSVILNASTSNSSDAEKFQLTTSIATSTNFRKPTINFYRIDIAHDTNIGELPDATAMTVNEHQYFWLNANNELYSSNLAGQDVQLLDKLSPRPSLRVLGEIHSNHDTLFFSDLATNSIMSYNVTRAKIIRQNKVPNTAVKKKFGMVAKLDSTHQVLLVETSRIYKFHIMDLEEFSLKTDGPCTEDSSSQPRVIDDDLTDHLKRQRLVSSYEWHLIEDIVQLTLVSLSILFVIIIVARGKQAKSDRQAFVNQEGA